MQERAKQSVSGKFLIVLIGALLMGFLWRARGTHGWGSSWGLLNAGIVFTLFITAALGARQKLDLKWTALTALSFMLTTPAWGTLLTQITGRLDLGEAGFAYVSPFSGVFMMLCLGFGCASIFGIMLGRGFSDKQWKLHHFIILIGVFYAVNLIAKASISHYILDFIQPESGKIFCDDLRAVGIKDSAYDVFMQHFDNDAWAKKFTRELLGRESVAGRNYFQEIKTISAAISALAVLITTRFIIKDKRAAATGTVTCLAFSFAITVSDLFFFFGNGGYHMLQGYSLPANFAPWSLWEYFTGFIAGGIITAFLVSIKPLDDIKEPTFNKLPAKATNIFAFLIGIIGMIGISVVRPVLERFDLFETFTTVGLVSTVIAVLVALIIAILLTKKYGLALERLSFERFCTFALPWFMIFIFFTYMFIGLKEYMNFVYLNELHNILVMVSFALVTGWSAFKVLKYNKD